MLQATAARYILNQFNSPEIRQNKRLNGSSIPGSLNNSDKGPTTMPNSTINLKWTIRGTIIGATAAIVIAICTVGVFIHSAIESNTLAVNNNSQYIREDRIHAEEKDWKKQQEKIKLSK